MWHCEEDIIKDLAFLNDFGKPGDKEPYKILYSVGRGTKLQKKRELPKKFVDWRTGEPIDLNERDEDENSYTKGKGRGSIMENVTKTKFMLQKQLRLVRPLGSGDEAIESFCRRNQPKIIFPTRESNKNTKTKSSSTEVSEKLNKKVKSTRSSTSQTNVLIQNLLAKEKNSSVNDSNQEYDSSNLPITKEKNFNSKLNENSATESLKQLEIINNDVISNVRENSEVLSELENAADLDGSVFKKFFSKKHFNQIGNAYDKNNFSDPIKNIVPLNTNTETSESIFSKSIEKAFVNNKDSSTF